MRQEPGPTAVPPRRIDRGVDMSVYGSIRARVLAIITGVLLPLPGFSASRSCLALHSHDDELLASK